MTKTKKVNLSGEKINDNREKQLKDIKGAHGRQAYTEKQINRLIVRSDAVVSAVLVNHNDLISCGYTPTQIYNMAERRDGDRNIEYCKALTPSRDIDLEKTEIVRILSNTGGAKNLQTYIEHMQTLRDMGVTWDELGLDKSDLVRILSHGTGAKNFQTYIKHMQTLRRAGVTWAALGLDKSDVVRILSHDGGSKNLDAFVQQMKNLLLKGQTWQTLLNLETHHVVRMLANDGGSQNLEAYIKHAQYLIDRDLTWDVLHLNTDEVVRILSHHGGSKNLDTCIKYILFSTNEIPVWASLCQKDVVRILSHGGGSKNFASYMQLMQSLHDADLDWDALNLNMKHIVRILAHGGGSNNLTAYINATIALDNENLTWESLKLDTKLIVRVVSSSGGSNRLKTLINLIKDAHAKNQTLEEYCGFPLKNIVKCLLEPNGIKTLDDIVLAYRSLEKGDVIQALNSHGLFSKTNGHKRGLEDNVQNTSDCSNKHHKIMASETEASSSNDPFLNLYPNCLL